MWQVTIDGEKHWMRLPDTEEYQAAVNLSPAYHANETFVRYQPQAWQSSLLLSADVVMDKRINFSNDDAMIHYRLNEDNQVIGYRQKEKPHHPLGILRPILIPLDENNQPICREFTRNNPDGTVLKAGRLLINNRPVSNPTLLEPGSILSVEDSSTDPNENLAWLIWRGRMCLIDSLLLVSPYDLQDFIETLELEEGGVPT